MLTSNEKPNFKLFSNYEPMTDIVSVYITRSAGSKIYVLQPVSSDYNNPMQFIENIYDQHVSHIEPTLRMPPENTKNLILPTSKEVSVLHDWISELKETIKHERKINEILRNQLCKKD